MRACPTSLIFSGQIHGVRPGQGCGIGISHMRAGRRRSLPGMQTCSERGVLNTRAAPNRSARPTVQRKTPPNLTSSPKVMAL